MKKKNIFIVIIMVIVMLFQLIFPCVLAVTKENVEYKGGNYVLEFGYASDSDSERCSFTGFYDIDQMLETIDSKVTLKFPDTIKYNSEEHDVNDMDIGGKGEVLLDKNVESLIFSNKLRSIAPHGTYFQSKKIKDVNLPNNLNEIGESIFCNNYIEELEIPSSLYTIEKQSFAYNKIKKLVINSGVREIGFRAFYGNDIQDVILPESVDYIGAEAFSLNVNLRNVTVLNKSASFAGSVFDNDPFLTKQGDLNGHYAGGPYKFAEEYILSDYLENHKINDIIIHGYKDSTAEEFAEKYGLKFVSLGNIDGLIYYTNEDSKTATLVGLENEEVLKSYNNDIILTVPEKINVNGITYTVDTIGSGALENSNIEGIELPSTIKVIEDGAFKDCKKLEEVVFPENVEEIGYGAFLGCSVLKNVYIPRSVNKIGKYVFGNQTNKLDVTICGYKNSTAEKYAKENELKFKWKTSIDGLMYLVDEDSKNVVLVGLENEDILEEGTLNIPETVNIDEVTYTIYRIESGAFVNCKKLETVIFSENIDELGDRVFLGCSALQSVYFPRSVNKIGPNIFGSGANKLNASICGYSNSTASRYASDNNIAFVNMEEPDELDVQKFGRENLVMINGLIYCATPNSDYAQLVSKKANIVLKMLGNDVNIKILEEIEHNSKKYKVNSIESYALKGGIFKNIQIPATVEQIKEGAFDSCETFTIEGYTGSCAEEYAKQNNIEFKSLGMAPYKSILALNWGADNYNFTNSSQYFSSYTIGDLKNHLGNSLKEEYEQYCSESESWRGSCYGMALTAMLFKYGYLTPTYWQSDNRNTENVYQLDNTSKNERLLWLINFYQVFQGYIDDNMLLKIDKQFNYDGNGEIINFYEGIKDFYDKNENRTQLLACDFYWEDIGGENVMAHEIIIAGKPEENLNGFCNNSSYIYRIPVYDNNESVLTFIYINNDFSNIVFGTTDNLYSGGFSINANQELTGGVLTQINAYKFSPKKMINIEEAVKNNETIESLDSVSMNINANSAVIVSNKQGNYTKIKNCKIEEGNLQCKIKPVLGITSDKNNKITKNNVFFEGGDWYSIETENETDRLNAKMHFGDSFMTVSTQSGAKAVFEDKKSIVLSNYSGDEYEATLTLNDEFVTLPWYTIKVNGKDSKELKLEMTDEGVLVTGDNLKNVTVTGKNSSGSIETNINTDNNVVLLRASKDNERLIAYIDTDNDGRFETPLNENKDEVKNKTDIDNAQTGDRVVLAIVMAVVSVILTGVLFFVQKYFNV